MNSKRTCSGFGEECRQLLATGRVGVVRVFEAREGGERVVALAGADVDLERRVLLHKLVHDGAGLDEQIRQGGGVARRRERDQAIEIGDTANEHHTLAAELGLPLRVCA